MCFHASASSRSNKVSAEQKIGLFEDYPSGSNCWLTKLLTKVGDKDFCLGDGVCVCVCLSVWVMWACYCNCVRTLVCLYLCSFCTQQLQCVCVCVRCVSARPLAVYLSSVQTDTGRDRHVFLWRWAAVAPSKCAGTEVWMKSPLHTHRKNTHKHK